MRDGLSRHLGQALTDTIGAIQEIRASRTLKLTPRLLTENLERFQVVIETRTTAPFQVDYLVKEPSGNVLSGLMMAPTRIAPDSGRPVRFRAQSLKPLTGGNDIYVLSGNVAHVPTDENPVPEFHAFEARYRAVASRLLEIDRVEIPVH